MTNRQNKNNTSGNLFATDIGERQTAATSSIRSTTARNVPSSQSDPASIGHNTNVSQAAQPTPDHVYHVSELNRQAGLVLGKNFGLIWLEAEVSNLSRPASGHAYFSLKDDQAQVRCALFRQIAMRTNAECLKEGAQVLVRAKVGLYEPRGDYQLIIQHIEDAGLGSLQRAFEALQKKLNAQGLFDASRKRALPADIRHVGIITSRTGAAVRDVISTIRRRNANLRLLLYPSVVQGEQAPASLRAALNLAITDNRADVLLLVRGGGSIEDLWAFNDEALAYAIAACPIPTVSGVGHEVDVTICDWVVDVRAPTPTAAAEMVAIDSREQLESLRQLNSRLQRAIKRHLHQPNNQLDNLAHRLTRTHPQQQYQQYQQKLDHLDAQLRRSIGRALSSRRANYTRLQSRLNLLSLNRRLSDYKKRLLRCNKSSQARTLQHVKSAQQASLANMARLNDLSPLAILSRGYAIAQNDEGRIIKSSQEAPSVKPFSLQFADQTIQVKRLKPR